MSTQGILLALRSGPKTTADLVNATGSTSGSVSRSCIDLQRVGKVKRIDGGSGRGSRAVYALVDDCRSATSAPRVRGYHNATAAKAPPVPEHLVERDPCFLCGVRADIGCRHRRAA